MPRTTSVGSEHRFQRRDMWFPAIVLLVILPSVVPARAEEIDCRSSSVADFVRDSLPKICFGDDSAGPLSHSMDNVEFYNAHCRLYQQVKQCLETKLKPCDDNQPGFARHALSLVESYQLPVEYFDYDAKAYDDTHYLQNLIPFCDGDKLMNHFQQQFDRSLLSCVTNATLVTHKQCLLTFKQNIQSILQTRASLNEITRWSEDFLRCVYNSIPTTCPTATKEIFVFRELLAVPEKYNNATSAALNITRIVKQKLPSQNVDGFAQSKRATSSIHGDPHLVQLHTNKAVTCRLLNNRTYISNPHFKITGVSKHVGDPELTATAITSLQIDFYHTNGTLAAYYRAQNGKIPLELVHLDSSSHAMVKIDHGQQSKNDAHLTFTHLPSSTQITVNSWSTFYYFLVRSSEVLLNNSHGYLITGCPQSEIIDRQMIIARLKERFARSQRQVRIESTRQRRQVLMRESDLPSRCEQICSGGEHNFADECIYDCLAIAVENPRQALRVNEMHAAASQEQRQLAVNDVRVVKEFRECYKRGVACKTMPDPDGESDMGLTRQASWSVIVMALLFSLLR